MSAAPDAGRTVPAVAAPTLDTVRHRHWRRLADPEITPVEDLRHARPGSLVAYLHLCRRPDLPAELVDYMVEKTATERSTVLQSSYALHLLRRRDLTGRHLLRLASRLAVHEFNDRARDQIVTHPAATPALLLTLCWHAAQPEAPMRPYLEAHRTSLITDGLTVAGPARAAVSAGNPVVDVDSFHLLVRRLRLHGPTAVTFAARVLPTWAGDRADLVAAAASVAAQRRT